MIPNHVAAAMSALDLELARAVPPGGNWRQVPEAFPSRRLRQIRQSAARGEGSRSSYYGRLRANEPAHTISTYFTRPGNGRHLHYDPAQDRTLSFREAARLQSFPDGFVFSGPRSAVARQIGNAVPPLLAFALARALGSPGHLVALFAGAGGLSRGFRWAGWRSLVAADVDAHALATYANNLCPRVVLGDVRDPRVRAAIVSQATIGHRRRPVVVVGGPPCQGFSTAGNRRSRADARNDLFRDYCALVEAIAPDAFLFENVPGLLDMDQGAVFTEIAAALGRVARELRVLRVCAEEHGVPQRRRRVILVGYRTLAPAPLPPGPCAPAEGGGAPVSVAAALDDLPPLQAGEDGSALPYRAAPRTAYQRLMRGELSAPEFVETLWRRASREPGDDGRNQRQREHERIGLRCCSSP